MSCISIKKNQKNIVIKRKKSDDGSLCSENIVFNGQ